MGPDARTPEELEAAFEDVFVARDPSALAAMFELGAILVAGPGKEARGPDRIAALIAALWDDRCTYVADPRLVVQGRDTALVLGDRSTSVMHRDAGGLWRYAIALASFEPSGGMR